MEVISKAIVWYPKDRRVIPAKISRCACGRVIVTEPDDEPVSVESPKGEHFHALVKALDSPRSVTTPQRDAGQAGHEGVKEIPVIFRD